MIVVGSEAEFGVAVAALKVLRMVEIAEHRYTQIRNGFLTNFASWTEPTVEVAEA